MSPRPAKRQKPAQPDKHTVFTQQAIDRGIEINGVQAAAIHGHGIGLITTKNVRKGEQLICVHEAAMIKPLPKYLTATSLSPQAKLTASLIAMEEASDEWLFNCRHVWPDVKDFASSLWWFNNPRLPADWEKFLPQALAQPRARLSADLINDLDSLRGVDESLICRENVYLWTIANTRSFSFKPTGRKSGIMVICPFLDYMNHCPSGQGCEVKQDTRGYTLVADRDYGVGEEILATYGAHSNDKLLVHYGFIVPESKDDSISLDEIILADLRPTQRESLESVGFLGNYTLSPQSGEICFRTQVAMRSLITTSNEWEFFMNSGEDIADDQDEKVQSELFARVKVYLPTLRSRRDSVYTAMKDRRLADEDMAAMGLCVQRLDQVEAALTEFCSPKT